MTAGSEAEGGGAWGAAAGCTGSTVNVVGAAGFPHGGMSWKALGPSGSTSITLPPSGRFTRTVTGAWRGAHELAHCRPIDAASAAWGGSSVGPGSGVALGCWGR